MDKRLHDGGTRWVAPLDAEVERELGNLVDSAAIWIRQFPTVRELDDALLRWRGRDLPRAEAGAIIQRARAQQVVSGADADSVKILLDADRRGGTDGEKAVSHAVLGLLNLLYRGGGLVIEDALARSGNAGEAPTLLTQRVKALLAAAKPEITRFIADLPADIKHAFTSLLADELVAPDSNGEAGTPEWADDWGTDAHGRWVAFSVPAADGKRISQRMRWIPPGRFMIGSPGGEVGRFGDEGPQQEVIIADGFWMFETTCTEALWEAVTAKAPHPRRGAEFPVTNVAWTDALR